MSKGMMPLQLLHSRGHKLRHPGPSTEYKGIKQAWQGADKWSLPISQEGSSYTTPENPHHVKKCSCNGLTDLSSFQVINMFFIFILFKRLYFREVFMFTTEYTRSSYIPILP